jgi:ACR3 family arsenite transporter
MSDTVRSHTTAQEDDAVLQRLSTLDRFLPVWIGVAMVGGLLLGRLVPGLDEVLAAVEIGSVSLPIAVGLLVMMYPVLAKVRYDSWVASPATAGCSPPRWCSTGCSGPR